MVKQKITKKISDTKENPTDIKESVTEQNWRYVALCFAIGFPLLLISSFLKNNEPWYSIFINLGTAFIVAGISIWILTPSGKVTEKWVEKVNETILSKMHLLDEAKKAGLLHIFSTRRFDDEFQKQLIVEFDKLIESIATIKRQINSGISPNQRLFDVKIMSNSSRDFFGKSRNNYQYYEKILEMVAEGIQFDILLLDPTSNAAVCRALVEEREQVMKCGYFESTLFTDIWEVTRWLNTPTNCIYKGKKISPDDIIKCINVRYYPYDPTVYLIFAEHVTFIEQYHKGGGDTIRKTLETQGMQSITCFGGFVPVFMVENQSSYGILMRSHFDNIWNDPDVKKRDLRIKGESLEFYGKKFKSYFEFIVDFKDHPEDYQEHFKNIGIELKKKIKGDCLI